MRELGVHVGDAEVNERVLAGPDAQILDRHPALLVGLLDPLRVDPAVGDQALQRQPADLTPDRVET